MNDRTPFDTRAWVKKTFLGSRFGFNRSSWAAACKPVQLLYHDWIVLEKTEDYLVGFTEPKKMLPRVIPTQDPPSYFFACFQIQPHSAPAGRNLVALEKQFYLQNVASKLYLCSSSEQTHCSSHLLFSKERNNRCLFKFQFERSEHQLKWASTGLKVKLISVCTNKYAKIQMSQNQQNEGLLWLDKTHDFFRIRLIKRTSADYDRFLKNCDFLLLEKRDAYIGVHKKKPFISRQQNTSQVTKDYFCLSNNSIIEIKKTKPQKQSLMCCLWQVQKCELQKDTSYLVKSSESVLLRHLETGLFLQIEENGALRLSEVSVRVMIANRSKFRCDILPQFQPICYDNPVILESRGERAGLNIQRVANRNFLLIFRVHLEELFRELFAEESTLDQKDFQELFQFYIYMFDLLCNQVQFLIDKGFYYLELTLLVFSEAKHFLNDGKLEIKKKLVNQMLRFFSIILNQSSVIERIFQQNPQKGKRIVKNIGALLPLNCVGAVNTLLVLAKQDPELVLKLLMQKMLADQAPRERYYLAQAANQIIDTYRSFNLSESKLSEEVHRKHRLKLLPESILLCSQLLEQPLEQICRNLRRQGPSNSRNERMKPQELKISDLQLLDNMYQGLYSLEMLKMLFREIEASKEAYMDMISDCLLKTEDAKVAIILITLLEDTFGGRPFPFQMKFVIYTGDSLQNTTPLANVLTFKSEKAVYLPQQKLEALIGQPWPEWEKNNLLEPKLKCLSKIVSLLYLLLLLAAYDVQTLSKIEMFALAVLQIFTEDPVELFQLTQAQMQQQQTNVLGGINMAQEDLLLNLKEMFKVLEMHRRRLLAYPIVSASATLNLAAKYRVLLRNKRLSEEMPILKQLLHVYEQEVSYRVMVFEEEECDAAYSLRVEQIIEAIDSFEMLINGFEKSNQELKAKWVGEMDARVGRILQNLKAVLMHGSFQKYSFAYDLTRHIYKLLMLLVSKHFDQAVVTPLLFFLLEKDHSSEDTLIFLKDEQKQLVELVSNKSCPPMLLMWIARCFQHLQSSESTLQFCQQICEQICEWICQGNTGPLTETSNMIGPSTNLLHLIGLLHETQCIQHQKLYFLLISRNKPLIGCLKTIRSFKQFSTLHCAQPEVMNDLSLFLFIIFRMCLTNSSFLHHARLIFNYDELKGIASLDNTNYYVVQSLFLFFTTDQPTSPTTQAYLSLALQILESHAKHIQQLDTYRAMGCMRKFEYGAVASSGYWNSLTSAVFHVKEEGVIPFIAHTIKQIRREDSQQMEYVVKGIVMQLVRIYSILGEKCCNRVNIDVLEMSIERTLRMVEEAYPKMEVFSGMRLENCENIKWKIYEALRSNSLLQRFSEVFREAPIEMKWQKELRVKSKQSVWGNEEVLEEMDDSNISQYALIIPSSKHSRTINSSQKVPTPSIFTAWLNKISLLTAKKLFLQSRLQDMLTKYFRTHNTLLPLFELIQQELEAERNDAIKNDESAYRFGLVSREKQEINIFMKEAASTQPLQLVSLRANLPIDIICDYLVDKQGPIREAERVRCWDLLKDCLERPYLNIQEVKHGLLSVQKLLKLLRNSPLVDLKQQMLSYSYRIHLLVSRSPQPSSLLLELVLICSQFTIIEGSLHIPLYKLVEDRCLRFLKDKKLKVAISSLLAAVTASKSEEGLAYLSRTPFMNKFICQAISSLCNMDLRSENIQVREQVEVVMSIFNYLHHANLNEHPCCSSTYRSVLVKLECCLYEVLVHKGVGFELSECLQSLAVQCLTYFHNLKSRSESIWNIKMLQTRVPYLYAHADLEYLRIVYAYYEDHYRFALVGTYLRAYPCSSPPTWNKEFQEILSEQSDSQQKKDVTISYALVMSQAQQSYSVPLLNQIHPLISSVILIMSTVALFSLSDYPSVCLLVFRVLIGANLLIMLLIIAQTCVDLFKKMHINAQKSALPYVLINYGLVVILALALLLINCLSFVNPFLSPLLHATYLLRQQHVLLDFSAILRRYSSILLAATTLYSTVFLLLALLINSPSESPSQLLPFSTTLDIGFLQVIFNYWPLHSDFKHYVFSLAERWLGLMVGLTIIVAHLTERYRAQGRTEKCQMCTTANPAQMEKHIKYEHNLHNYLGLFVYLLSAKQYLSSQEMQIQARVLRKDKSLL